MIPKFFKAAVDTAADVAGNLRDKVTDEKFLRQVKSSASTTAKNLRENVSTAVDTAADVAGNLSDKVTDEKFLRQVKNSASTTAKNLRENVNTAVDTAATVAQNLRGKIVEKNFVMTREISEDEVPPDVREKIAQLERTPVLEKIDVNATTNVGEKIVHDVIKKFNKSFGRS